MGTNYVGHNGAAIAVDSVSPEGDQPVEVLMIDDKQRRKLFGYAKAAWTAAGSPGDFNNWRHEQQQLCGVSSLKFAPREKFFELVQLYSGIIRAAEGKAGETPAVQAASNKPSSGPTYADGSLITANSNSRRVLIVESCSNQPQLRKINALLVDQSLSWEYADSIALRMFKVKQVQWCNAKQLQAVISALTKRQQKKGGRRTPKAEQTEMFPRSKPGAPQ